MLNLVESLIIIIKINVESLILLYYSVKLLEVHCIERVFFK